MGKIAEAMGLEITSYIDWIRAELGLAGTLRALIKCGRVACRVDGLPFEDRILAHPLSGDHITNECLQRGLVADEIVRVMTRVHKARIMMIKAAIQY